MQVSDLFRFKNREIKALHLTWIAFFICFYVWFNMAPLASSILRSANWLTKDDLRLFAIANVALTIPARILVGMALDRFGPRRVFSLLMITMAVPTLFFAFGDTKEQLFVSRLVLSSVGAQLCGRHPHDRAVVQTPRHRLRRGLLRWLGQLRFGRRCHDHSHHRADHVRRRRRLALCRGPVGRDHGLLRRLLLVRHHRRSHRKTPTRSPASPPRWRCQPMATWPCCCCSPCPWSASCSVVGVARCSAPGSSTRSPPGSATARLACVIAYQLMQVLRVNLPILQARRARR